MPIPEDIASELEARRAQVARLQRLLEITLCIGEEMVEPLYCLLSNASLLKSIHLPDSNGGIKLRVEAILAAADSIHCLVDRLTSVVSSGGALSGVGGTADARSEQDPAHNK